MSPVRVGFRAIYSRDWQGGHNYLLNLHRALLAAEPREVEPVLFCGLDAPEADGQGYEELLGDDLVRSDVFAPRRLRRRRARALILGRDAPAERRFRDHGVDVVFENADFYGRSFGLPAIAWIPDFQHRHLPEMFSRARYWRRELGFRAQFAAGRQVMLSSEDARRDCRAFYGLAEDRIDVVRFAVPFEGRPDEDLGAEAVRRYGLPERFFFLPNQFWRHKNHGVVVDALHELGRRGRDDVVVAVSGGASHPTNVAVLDGIRAKVRGLGLESRFRLLGRIPYADVLRLFARCHALLNPSRFEGWSTTIEEAKAQGVPTLLSDLPVHREQVPEGGVFFDPSRPSELADALSAMQDEAPSAPRDEEELLAASRARMAAFVGDFARLARARKGSAP